MIGKLFCSLLQKPRYKNRGDALILSLFFSVFILLIGVALSKSLIRDMFAIRSIVFTEKSYYGAESGIEIALNELEAEPINDIEVTQTLSQSTVDLKVVNKVLAETFRINPAQTQRLRFAYDSVSSTGVNIEPISDLSITTDTSNLLWKVICRNGDLTVSIQGNETTRLTNDDFFNLEGIIDKSVGATSLGDVNSFMSSGVDEKTCYLNLQNLGTGPMEVTLESADWFSPLKTNIVSTGSAGQKTKVITFDSQNSLGSFFDFGFLHQE